MLKHYDVVIIGGAVIGSAVAYYLASNPDFDGSILIVEKDMTFSHASTALSFSGIRMQFSNAINVEISKYGYEIIRNFGDMMEVDGDKPDLQFHPGGYLFLARDDRQVRVLKENHAVQKSCSADVVLWDRNDLSNAFPHLRTDDIQIASYGQSGEGWFNNTGIMAGFRNKARSMGVEVIKDEVVEIARTGNRVTGVQLASGGAVSAGTIVNASGARATQVARMAGIHVPIEPRKRTVFVFDCAQSPEGTATVNDGYLPLMIDPTGVYCRPEGRYFLGGCVPKPDLAVDWNDFEPDYASFENIIWPALAERSEAFEAIKVVNQWAGHYAYNVLDHNLIVGPHSEVENFIFANGFSGHGLQQGPATGRAVSELITYNEFRTLDLSPLGYERVVANQPFFERAII